MSCLQFLPFRWAPALSIRHRQHGMPLQRLGAGSRQATDAVAAQLAGIEWQKVWLSVPTGRE
jgi:hypothetical protein